MSLSSVLMMRLRDNIVRGLPQAIEWIHLAQARNMSIGEHR